MPTEEAIKKIIAEQLGVAESEINMNSSMTADLGADSLDTVEVAMALEDEFGVQLSDEKCSTCSTVGDWAKLVTEAAASAQS